MPLFPHERAFCAYLITEHDNVTKFNYFHDVFLRFFENDSTLQLAEVTSVLQDLRWKEAGKAFALALNDASSQIDLRPEIPGEFEALIQTTVFLCFGSTRRETLPPWFLEQIDAFFYESAMAMMQLYECQVVVSELLMEKTWTLYFEMQSVCKVYMLFNTCSSTSAVQPLLVSFERTRKFGNFLRIGSPKERKRPEDMWVNKSITTVHKVFANVLASCIVSEWTDFKQGKPQKAYNWKDGAFPYLNGSILWQNFFIRVAMAPCKGQVSKINKLVGMIKQECSKCEKKQEHWSDTASEKRVCEPMDDIQHVKKSKTVHAIKGVATWSQNSKAFYEQKQKQKMMEQIPPLPQRVK